MQPRLWLGRRESLSWLSVGEGTALPRLAVRSVVTQSFQKDWVQHCRAAGPHLSGLI